MPEHDWTSLGKVDPGGLTEARLQAHQAVQWLARTAYANLEATPGDSHANLGWNGVYGALMTRTLPNDVVVGLRLRDLTLFVERDGAASMALSLEGADNFDAGRWLADELARCGLAPARYDAGLPYGDDLPDRVTGLEGAYSVVKSVAQMKVLSGWFSNADAALRTICEENADLSPGPSEVRCWPHHFDIATLISLDDRDPERARSIGVGLSPGDGSIDEPYFYVSPWPAPDASVLPPLPGIGRWNTEGFVGAIATGTDIATAADQSAVMAFLRGAVSICRGVL